MLNKDEISEAIISEIIDRGYDLEKTECLGCYGEFVPSKTESFWEGLFYEEEGETYFLCGQGGSASPYRAQSGLFMGPGIKLYPVASDQAEEWMGKHK